MYIRLKDTISKLMIKIKKSYNWPRYLKPKLVQSKSYQYRNITSLRFYNWLNLLLGLLREHPPSVTTLLRSVSIITRPARLRGPAIVLLRSPAIVRLRSPTIIRLRRPAIVRLGSPAIVRLGSPAIVRLRSPAVIWLRSPAVVRCWLSVWSRRLWWLHVWSRRLWRLDIWSRRLWQLHIWSGRLWQLDIWSRSTDVCSKSIRTDMNAAALPVGDSGTIKSNMGFSTTRIENVSTVSAQADATAWYVECKATRNLWCCLDGHDDAKDGCKTEAHSVG